MSAEKRVLGGVCTFHSETGTEGGYWAFQDEKFIKRDAPRGYCKKCGLWMRPQNGVIQATRVHTVSLDADGQIKADERPICADGDHEEYVGDEWSYKGLHILKNGDRLTIFSKDNPEEVAWEGIINLHYLPLFTEDAHGLWIHHDQDGVVREEWALWFFKCHPARLELA